MKNLKIFLLLLLLLPLLLACSNSAQSDSTVGKEPTEETSTNTSSGDDPKIVVYFSRVGNTDFPDDVDATSSASIVNVDGNLEGNAGLIAQYLAQEEGCDTFEIQTESTYPVVYNEVVSQARDEQSQKARPALKTNLDNLSNYKTIYLVFPNWWGDLPMPVYTFLENNDLSDKTIDVFVTHEGSGFSDTVETIKELEPDATVVEGLDIRGGSVQEEEADIRQWVKNN